jgi:hypothetical protein
MKHPAAVKATADPQLRPNREMCRLIAILTAATCSILPKKWPTVKNHTLRETEVQLARKRLWNG